jgi:signal transduction histidine kinase
MGKLLESDSIPFQAEGRLLQELGLRLVASPEVALVELIKNSYDADSPSCTVRLEQKQKKLVVADRGLGMTLDDFKNKWMRIATSSKTGIQTSPKFGRQLTGAKGIGRFAVRYLGDHLALKSVAFDPIYKCTTLLEAAFDWPKLDIAKDISKVAVDYSLTQVSDGTATGTTLTITRLRSSADFTRATELRDDVLRIVSPLQGLDRGRFARTSTKSEKDPGFNVVLPGSGDASSVDLATSILGNYWGRLTIDLHGTALRFEVSLPGLKRPRSLRLRVPNDISAGLHADIRYFPRRKGVFRAKDINGREAWKWVRDNCGVKVVDHGFHIHPYGFENDDWLLVDRDSSHNEREWRTEIARKYFAVSAVEKTDPAENPVLNLPSNFQLVGAVFIETRRNLGGEDRADLVPAMDREGLLENEAFAQLSHFVRAGVEFLAHEDKAELQRREIAAAKEAARTARAEIRQAIKFIESSPTLTRGDKTRIINHYRRLADRVDETEEYSAQARRSLLTMSLLGVVAGFMTHESKAAVHELEQAVIKLRKLAKKHPELSANTDELSQRLENFQGYLDYTRLFVQNVRLPTEQELSASGQVRYILNRFKKFAEERDIEVKNEIAPGVTTPPLPVTVYSGILLNLYTNALKAVIAAKDSVEKPKIVFRGWTEATKHVVEVSDNGVGIPPEMRKRIWEPLYTTTSDVGNPLGSGMGLGLTLIKQVVNEVGGSILLVSTPPPGFTTSFRIIFPKKKKNKSQ